MINTQERFNQEPIELDTARKLSNDELKLVAGGSFWDDLGKVWNAAVSVAPYGLDLL